MVLLVPAILPTTLLYCGWSKSNVCIDTLRLRWHSSLFHLTHTPFLAYDDWKAFTTGIVVPTSCCLHQPWWVIFTRKKLLKYFLRTYYGWLRMLRMATDATDATDIVRITSDGYLGSTYGYICSMDGYGWLHTAPSFLLSSIVVSISLYFISNNVWLGEQEKNSRFITSLNSTCRRRYNIYVCIGVGRKSNSRFFALSRQCIYFSQHFLVDPT